MKDKCFTCSEKGMVINMTIPISKILTGIAIIVISVGFIAGLILPGFMLTIWMVAFLVGIIFIALSELIDLLVLSNNKSDVMINSMNELVELNKKLLKLQEAPTNVCKENTNSEELTK